MRTVTTGHVERNQHRVLYFLGKFRMLDGVCGDPGCRQDVAFSVAFLHLGRGIIVIGVCQKHVETVLHRTRGDRYASPS